MRKPRLVLLSLALSALTLMTPTGNALAVMPSAKVYDTGENLPKPMIMSRFVEMTSARKVDEATFESLSGDQVKLSDYRGKLVLINLWATWCAPCIKEIPMMDKIRRDNLAKDLVVLPLSIDEAHDEVGAFLARHQLAGYPTLIDPQRQVEKMLPANIVPATYAFDGEGNLIGFLRGYLDWGDKAVQPYLERLTAKYAKPNKAQNLH
ncbi:TlpA family protein disulfide reductase [Shewanella aegiceratis]|uniref:TlpA family protein disulfide reductase n=1 Tax=Shewanella aegiceratis TaxID=2864203 RepID=UPI001C65B0AE|nr:TlpA disulfide reductase family protein [Shewanella aegiceratis]QYJ82777.1 TlpA family protein disulfide reductase [Shewanella aegiceratis]